MILKQFPTVCVQEAGLLGPTVSWCRHPLSLSDGDSQSWSPVLVSWAIVSVCFPLGMWGLLSLGPHRRQLTHRAGMKYAFLRKHIQGLHTCHGCPSHTYVLGVVYAYRVCNCIFSILSSVIGCWWCEKTHSPVIFITSLPIANKQESVFKLFSYQGNVNASHTEAPSIASQNGCYR